MLTNEELTKQYYEECAFMANRIGSMRKLLVEELKAAGSTHDWSHITSQIGMFAFTGKFSFRVRVRVRARARVRFGDTYDTVLWFVSIW